VSAADELTPGERERLRAEAEAAVIAARRAARLPRYINDPEVLAKAAVLLARYDDDGSDR
jgi:hypothetical protein